MLLPKILFGFNSWKQFILKFIFYVIEAENKKRKIRTERYIQQSLTKSFPTHFFIGKGVNEQLLY